MYKLVQWTKRLPFYLELPVEVHTNLLTRKWHEILVITTSAYQAMHGQHRVSSSELTKEEFDHEVQHAIKIHQVTHYTSILTFGFNCQFANNMYTLQACLASMMGQPITMEQLKQDVGVMVRKITHVTIMFRRVKLRMEEYVCLKVITMLSKGNITSYNSCHRC